LAINNAFGISGSAFFFFFLPRRAADTPPMLLFWYHACHERFMLPALVHDCEFTSLFDIEVKIVST
jgi:hypothetical protein